MIRASDILHAAGVFAAAEPWREPTQRKYAQFQVYLSSPGGDRQMQNLFDGFTSVIAHRPDFAVDVRNSQTITGTLTVMADAAAQLQDILNIAASHGIDCVRIGGLTQHLDRVTGTRTRTARVTLTPAILRKYASGWTDTPQHHVTTPHPVHAAAEPGRSSTDIRHKLSRSSVFTFGNTYRNWTHYCSRFFSVSISTNPADDVEICALGRGVDPYTAKLAHVSATSAVATTAMLEQLDATLYDMELNLGVANPAAVLSKAQTLVRKIFPKAHVQITQDHDDTEHLEVSA